MRRAIVIVAVCSSMVATFASLAVKAQDAPGNAPSGSQVSDEGKQIYEQVCQACHMADARGGGATGAAIPALAGNAKLSDSRYMLSVVIKGRGGMPWFTEMLTPAQIAAVVNYVRHHFNSYPDTVSEADVVAAIEAKGTLDP